ncbi:P-loop NTPase fold protein [Paenibacillus sp. FSL H7-689]|uniref:P-loop NTPase fold protein n=1 Tax=Paenibacillus sp. FSL H7-689 TaxID=1227349 RepID=UPI0003E22566|nr:P-loop NTPase fold protein [Paenibacillus sp. FSL H7-689]ETT56075.1 KAP P-loop domain-containing protein [Paenibacillus sp. FSL H7-689]
MRKNTIKNIIKSFPFQNPVGRKKIVNKTPLYLQDSPVTNRKEDKFQYGQMADIIYELLEEGQLPLHIGLMGSWGTGKTSVLRLLETKVNAERKSERKYLLKFINVWKFADDAPSLHRKIVREVEAELKVEKKEGISHETTIQQIKKTSGVWSIFQKELWKKHGIIILLYVITLIIVTVLYEWLFNFKDPWALSFTSTTSLLAILIANNLLNKNGLELTYQTQQKELALLHGDQFEHRFESAVSEYLKANKGKKLILVFDDLDRLPPKQLVAALNTIKTFLRSNQCAFIVPCDEEVLLEGISSAFNEKKMSNLSVSEFLNKTFDLQLHLPHVEKVNMRTYAKNILSEQQVKWTLDENIPVDRLLGILIHTGVRTPRQVKKILNAYAFDWYLALKRDAEAGVEFLSKHSNHIAIFTVLKTDFPNYYHAVSQNPFIIQKPIKDQIRKIYYQDEPPLEENENSDESTHDLEAFLSRVKGNMPADPRPFIYFNNQLLNPLTGRPELENTKEYLLNGQDDEFHEEFYKLSFEDMQIVLSSTLEDIDTTSNIFAGNVLKVLFADQEALKFIKEIDLNRWEKIIVENITHTDDFFELATLDICLGLEKLQCGDFVWKTYGQAISDEVNHELIFNLWVEHPNYVTNLGLSKIGQGIISTLKSENKSHIAVNKLPSISHNNSILRNQTFDWINTILNAVTSDDLPDIPLATLLPIWAQKTEGLLTTSIINELLAAFNFKNPTYLEGVGTLWCELYEVSDSKQADMNSILDLMDSINFSGFTEEDLNYIASQFDELEYKAISSRVRNIFSSWWKEDEEKTFSLMDKWSDAPGIASFACDIFSFALEEKILKLGTEIISRRSAVIKKRLDSIVTIIKGELTDASNNHRRTTANTIIDLLVTDSLWAEKLQSLIAEFFPPDATTIWLQWPPIVAEDRADLLVSFLKINDDLADWTVLSIFDLLKVRNGFLGVAYTNYRNNHTIYINLILNRLLNSEQIDWKSFLEKAIQEKLIDHLDPDTMDSLLITLGKKLELDNETYIDFFITHHNSESEYHRDIAIRRWDFFNLEERKTYLEKYDSIDSRNEFGIELANMIEIKPSLKYIDELSTWNFKDNISQKIVMTTIQKVDEQKLNSWFQKSILKIIKEMDKWTMFALLKAARTRDDLDIPKKETLDTLLLLKDQRSILSLDILKKNKNVANTLRSSIGSLKDTYPDEVEEVKKEFKWRKF